MRIGTCSLLIFLAAFAACSQENNYAYGGAGDGGDCSSNPAGCVCTTDSQCSGLTPRCDKNSGKCVPCLPANDNCARGSRCVATNDTFSCSASCQSSADCGK